ncbi:MAG: YgjV family protein [Defluviitaleaceae bacterium]|nr:YgjV family protein [Defluviitaleaceae bacterium]
MDAIIEVFRSEIYDIIHYHSRNPIWITSQVFAFFALVTMFWSFQIKDKLKMMLLLGLGTTFLAISAAFLGNWTLTVLFGVASLRNYVFCYFEWRGLKNRPVARKWWWVWAAIFISTTVISTIVLVYIVQVDTAGAWLEWLITITLSGLVIGNVISGTHLMRVSFVANRAFNIINHWYFSNIIAVIIACLTISSNIIFYTRELIAWIRKRRAEKLEVEEARAEYAQRIENAENTEVEDEG